MRKRVVVSVVLGVLFSVTSAHADPILITGGGISANSPNSGIDWSGFVLTGTDSGFSGVTTAGPALAGFSGGVINLSGGANLISTVPFPLATQQMVNGTAYTAFVNGGLTFTTPSIVVPPPSSTATSFEFSAPFTANGHIAGTATLATSAPVLFSTDLTGSGTTTIRGRVITQTDQPFYLTLSQAYQFQAAAATPEPAPLVLLLASGLLVAWRRVRDRCGVCVCTYSYREGVSAIRKQNRGASGTSDTKVSSTAAVSLRQRSNTAIIQLR